MGSTDFQGRIKRIQWNNQVISGLMMVYFVVSILVFVSLIFLVFLSVTYIFDPNSVSSIAHSPVVQRKFARIFGKIVFFSFAGAYYFIYRDFKDAGTRFGGTKVNLKHDDAFYKELETQCISRGLKVPELYVIDHKFYIDPSYTTGAVLQGPSGQSKLIITPATYSIASDLRKAFIAQVVQRLYTKDVYFLTLLCFLGYFTFHIEHGIAKLYAKILRPFLWTTDRLMSPVRKIILNLRLAKLDVGSLELIKDKANAHALMGVLTSLEDIGHYYHEAYLPLFIAKSEGPYRLRTLEKA